MAASALRHGGHPAVKGSRFFLTGRLLAIAKAPCSKHSKVYFVLFMYEEVKGLSIPGKPRAGARPRANFISVKVALASSVHARGSRSGPPNWS